jgi:crotonobetainyl-CoA:carnitine CoA-transferase CaiB-like acyl-CoA transferase
VSDPIAAPARPPLPDLGAGARHVLEIAHGVAGAMAGMYLAKTGFQVTRVVATATGTRPDGFTSEEYGDVGPIAHGFLHEGKETIELDLAKEADRDRLTELVGRADLVVEQLHASEKAALGDGYAAAIAARPDLVVVTISPFGTVGSPTAIPATELVVDAAGGWLQHIGEPDQGPIRPPGHQSEVMGALAAVTSGVASLLQADKTGQGETIDVASRECVIWFQMNPTTVYAYSGSLGHRTGGASDVNYPQGVFSCADGLVGINVLYYVEWFRFCDLLGRDDWKTDPRLETPLLRFQNRALIDKVLLPYLATRTAAEIYAAGQAHRLPFGMVNGPVELLASRQLASRRFWRTGHLNGREVVLPELPAVYTAPPSQGDDR